MTVNEQAYSDVAALTRENRPPEGDIEVVRYDPRLTETQDKVKDDIGGLDGLIVNAYLPTFSRAIALSGTKPKMVRDRAPGRVSVVDRLPPQEGGRRYSSP